MADPIKTAADLEAQSIALIAKYAGGVIEASPNHSAPILRGNLIGLVHAYGEHVGNLQAAELLQSLAEKLRALAGYETASLCASSENIVHLRDFNRSSP